MAGSGELRPTHAVRRGDSPWVAASSVKGLTFPAEPLLLDDEIRLAADPAAEEDEDVYVPEPEEVIELEAAEAGPPAADGWPADFAGVVARLKADEPLVAHLVSEAFSLPLLHNPLDDDARAAPPS